MPRSAAGTRLVAGILPQAVSLNGSTAYLATSGNAAAAFWPASALTYAIWVRPAALPATSGGVMGLLDKFSAGSGYRLDLYCPSTTQQILFQSGASSITPSVTLPLGEWSHVAGTVAGTTATVYVNGVQIGTGTVAAVANNTSVNQVIGSGQGAQFFHGLLADARLYTVALSQAQVQAVMQRGACGLEGSMALWLPCQEGSGVSCYDRSGNGATAGFNGSAAWATANSGPLPARSAAS